MNIKKIIGKQNKKQLIVAGVVWILIVVIFLWFFIYSAIYSTYPIPINLFGSVVCLIGIIGIALSIILREK